MLANVENAFRVMEVEFEPGDFLVLYSDGIPEAFRNQKESYGMERFQKACAEAGKLSDAVAIKDFLLEDVKKFREGYKQQDDITIIVLKML